MLGREEGRKVRCWKEGEEVREVGDTLEGGKDGRKEGRSTAF